MNYIYSMSGNNFSENFMNNITEKIAKLHRRVKEIVAELEKYDTLESVTSCVYYMTDNNEEEYPKTRVWYVNITAETRREKGTHKYEFDMTDEEPKDILFELEVWFRSIKAFLG
jgi:hypothetical protein